VSAAAYEEIRSTEPDDAIERAVRFLFLNRTAFSGMYRLNRDGKFNVPYGGGERTPEILWKHDLVGRASHALRETELRVSDFESVIQEASAGDVIYCDPTYTVAHSNNGFVRYNERNFAWADQQRLAREVRAAADRGAVALISNAYHPSLLDLYAGEEVRIVERKSTISRVATKRGTAKECLFIVQR
jgi:DNA adenine methylase